MAASEAAQEVVLPWLKTLPLAPEYRPSLSEFQDPISYIFKIEKEASKYGICKIVPPVPPSPKKTVIPNLNQSLLARNPDSDPKSAPTFTTRQQQIGFCPRKPRPVQRPVWQSGERYTFQEFEAKAKAFEKAYLKKCGGSGSGNGNGKKTTPLSALEIETLYWKATVDKPFRVEYANDMPGSAFVPLDSKKSKISSSSSSSSCEGVSLGETAWNMRGVSRANGSLLKFMKEEIPGVTSPMVYVAMMFSWFAWHVEDHDLHSLNYLHMGAGKTWYGVPREAAVAFEEVVRVHGYGGEINPLVTFATLGEKTTVMSPEVFIGAGVPCCRLVQNAGEFVVTFPRAYHTGFSHGFNCGEAANIATPEWLRVAKDAAIRRASINYPPMVSHFQLLYDLALALHSRMPMGNSAGPRSSRLKDKKKGEGETVVKELFAQNVVQNNELLHILGKGSSIVLLPRSSSDVSVCSKLRVGSQLRVNPTLTPGLCSSKEVNQGIGQVKSFLPVKGKFSSFYERSRISSSSGFDNICSSNSKTLNTDSERGSAGQGDGLSDQRLFSCVTCGILSFACVAIVQPREPASRYLMTADCSFLNDWAVGSGITGNGFTVANGDAITSDQNTHPGWMEKSISLFDVPVQSLHGQHQMEDQSYEVVSNTETQREPSALGLLAMTYGNSSDSEDDQGEPDFPACADKKKLTNSSSESIYQGDNSGLPSMQDCPQGATGVRSPSLSRHGVEDGSNQTSDCSAEFRTDDLASRRSDGLMDTFSDPITVSHVSSDCSLDVHDVEQTKFGKENVPRENKNMSFAPRSDEDSSRMHVFCLEHAKEVEKQLRPIGGVHILLLCHPDYPKIVDDAKSLAEEMGIDYPWNNITFRDATKEDEDRIRSALDSQEAIPGNGDWAVKLGINLFYSANLSRSPLYSKQMPYNSVIYNAFGRCSPASSPKKAKVYRRRSGRQRKVVAGKWCGKVWMSHQVHPFLAKGDSDEEEEEDMSFQTWTMPDEKLEIKSESTHKSETTMVARKYGRKRKMTVESGSSKKAKFIDRGDAFFDYSAEDNSHQQGRTLRGKLAKSIERDEAVSDDSLDNYSHELQRTSKSKEAFFDEREDAVSDDSLIDDSHQQHRRIHRGKQSKCFDKEDAISDSSLGHNFHQHNRRIVKSKIRREAFSDDSLEGNSHQQIKRYNRRNQAKCIEREDAVLDDSLGVNSHKQHRRLPKIKQATSIEREDAVSDVPLDDDSHQQHRRILRSKPMRAEISQPMKKGPPRRVKKGTSWATKQVPRRPIKRESPQLMKQQTPRLRNNQSERNSSHIGLLVEEDQGGPSTRLRKRTKKTVKESEAKPKAKKQASRIKVRKNASVVKAPAGHNDPKIGDGEVEFLCDIEGCTMSFGSKHELVLHKRNVCPVKGCGKKFFSHKYLVQHRRVHLDERPLRCPWKGCKMTFKWAWARTEHIRVHTGARPYVCGEPGCGQTFRFVSDFSRHKRKTGHSAKKGR